jgi:hypothetical protein
MTSAERLADRIAKNREIDKRVSQRVVPEKKSAAAAAAGASAVGVASRQKAVRGALDKFQQIKVTQGVDAAAEFVRGRKA